MLSPARNASRCIYCAYRTQLHHRQLVRLGQIRNIHIETNRTPDPSQDTRRGWFRLSEHRNEADRKSRNRHKRRSQQAQNRFGQSRRGKLEDEGDDRGAPLVRKHGVGRTQTLGRSFRFDDGRGSFEEVLPRRLEFVKGELKDAPLLEELRKERQEEGEKAESFKKIWERFVRRILPEKAVRKPFFGLESEADTGKEKIVRKLREVYKARGQQGLDDRLKYEFYAHITGSRFTPSDIKNQQSLADLRYPSEWFPGTRTIRRTIHLHVGPTNSGKTYHALQRLEAAEKGVYAGPLRLLAHEVYTRLNARGKPCALVTGEERRMPPKPEAEVEGEGHIDMAACTVEMMPLNRTLDVAVIDEIQMIGNADRGWAWTQALLGVKAREVHLCGEERAVGLVREICAGLGEKLEVHRYTRLSPLKVAEDSLDGDLTKLRKGDCVVSFSVMGIHSLRRQIERATGRKVATVYGSLPPETRAQQARLFNDPNNDYDYLVASDAVGMGLNLAIKRIIFESSAKFDGFQHRTLAVADIKQIAGRAGRYRTAAQATQQETPTQDLSAAKGEPTLTPSLPPAEDAEATAAATENTDTDSKENENTGYVTTLQKFDYPTISAAMSSEPTPLLTAGLFPPAPVLERFAGYFPPGTPFSYILTRLHELSQMHTRFHLCGLKDQVWIADMIEHVKGLTITDRNFICSAPASGTDRQLWKELMPAYARCIAEQSGGGITEIEELPLEVLEVEVSASREYLRELELLHKGVVTYLWLSYRFAGVFGQRNLAFHVKSLVEEKIEVVLSKFSFSDKSYKKVAERRQWKLLQNLGADAEDSETAGAEGLNVVKEIDEAFDIDPLDRDRSLRRSLRRGEEDVLRQQTSLTGGGDHFAGEEDIGLDPEEEKEFEREEEGQEDNVVLEADDDVVVVSELDRIEDDILRAAQRSEDDITSETSKQPSADAVIPVRAAADQLLTDSYAEDDITNETSEQPSVAEVMPELAAVDQLSSEPRGEDEEPLSPEMHPGHLEATVMPETEMDAPPMETQEVSPKPTEDQVDDDGPWNTPRKPQPVEQRQGDGGVPHKHLAHMDVNASELERNVESRP